MTRFPAYTDPDRYPWYVHLAIAVLVIIVFLGATSVAPS